MSKKQTKPNTADVTTPGVRSRRSGAPTSDTLEYNDPTVARTFLEKHHLLVPDGAEITTGVLAACMHQVAGLEGVTKQAERAIRSLATMMECMADDGIKESIRELILGELNSMVEDINGTLEGVKKDMREEVSKHVETLKQAATTQKPTQQDATETDFSDSPYKDALAKPPPSADPRIAAKEGIRARQFLIDLRQDSPLRQMTIQQIHNVFNKVAAEAGKGVKNAKIRTMERLSNKGLLGEFATDEGARCFAIPDNADDLLLALGDNGRGASVRARIFNTIAFFVPIHFNPEEDFSEVAETNSYLSETDIVRAKWVKNPDRRDPNQRFAHLLLAFNHPDAANEAILRGLYICGKKVTVGKAKKEPMRCLKCQGWNHIAAECKAKVHTCGFCGTKDDHQSNECQNKRELYCTPCGSAGHASSDRLCPTFAKRCTEYDERHPENAIPFFPSTQPWTWHHETPALKPLERNSNPRSTNPKDPAAQTQYRQQSLSGMIGSQASTAKSDIYKRRRTPNRDKASESTDKQDAPLFPHPELATLNEEETPQAPAS